MLFLFSPVILCMIFGACHFMHAAVCFPGYTIGIILLVHSCKIMKSLAKSSYIIIGSRALQVASVCHADC